ncbi:MAG: AraC family transcriptional regulator ligand-binding domain-containing protein [Rhodanobacter sp.]
MPRSKLEVRQFIPEITPYTLVALTELVADYGVAPERLCEGMTFTLKELLRGTLVSNRQTWRMIRRALRLTGRADLGIELGCRQDMRHFGLPGVAMTVQGTFEEAAALAMRYQKQNGSLVEQTLSFNPADECAVLVARPRINDPAIRPFLLEEFLVSALFLVRTMLGREFTANSMEFAYRAPSYVERYRELFGCKLTFDCPQNRVFIGRHWLETRLPGRSPVMAAELEAIFEIRANAANSPSDIVTTVESLLMREGNIALSFEQTAKVLDVSIRTLRRRLDETGTTFRQLSDRARARVAMDLLCRQGMTVASVAERLGFSDPRAFRRAFKRWEGQLPGPLRRSVDTII